MTRGHRLQIMLPPQEVRKVDDWRFMQRMPSRAAAVRALLKLGLASIEVDVGRADSSRRMEALPRNNCVGFRFSSGIVHVAWGEAIRVSQ